MVSQRIAPSISDSASDIGALAGMTAGNTAKAFGRKLKTSETSTANLIGGLVVINATLMRIEHRLAAIQWILFAGLMAGLLKMFGAV